MASYQISPHQLWKTLYYFGKNFSATKRAFKSFKIPTTKSFLAYSPSPHFQKDYSRLSWSLRSNFSGIASSSNSNSSSSDSIKAAGNVQMQRGSVVLDSDQNEDNLAGTVHSSNGRVMLIDGTSIIYRAYYRLLAKLHHGHLSHADGNGDWVLTIFTALSLIIDVLEFIPSHVAVVFDHDGVPFGPTSVSSQQNFVSKGLNFRHTLYPLYKSHRPPTPDTIVQGLQYLKASIKAMSIKVIEVPGVEGDDVIGPWL